MGQEQGYQGWTNYETWVVALMLDNDQGTANHVRELYDEAKAQADGGHDVWTPEEHIRFGFADALKSDIEDQLPSQCDINGTLCRAAFEAVNWQEIADNLIEKYTA